VNNLEGIRVSLCTSNRMAMRVSLLHRDCLPLSVGKAYEICMIIVIKMDGME